jgi:hypothetical protein
MKKTHYESLVYGGQFGMLELFKKLEPYLPSEDFTWDDIMKIPLIKEIVDGVMGKQKSEDVLTVTQVIFHSYAFYKGSGRVYEVSDSIAEMLLNTKLDIDVSLVKSPFREVMILVPENLIQIYNRDTGMHNVYTIYANLEERSDTDKTLKVMCVGRENEKSHGKFDDAVFYFKIDFGPGTIMESLKKCIDEWGKNPNHSTFSTMNDTDIMPRLFQFTLNTLLYITSADCDLTMEKSQYGDLEKKLENLHNPAKIRKLQQRMDRESRFHKYVIGRSIQLSQEEKDLYDMMSIYEPMRTGKHMVRYAVGGHWRMQPYGSRENPVKKPKWIRPHFRGPEIADLIKSMGVLK